MAAQVWTYIEELAQKGWHTTMQWVPLHCGIERNEVADELAGAAIELDQQDVPLSLDGHRQGMPVTLAEDLTA